MLDSIYTKTLAVSVCSTAVNRMGLMQEIAREHMTQINQRYYMLYNGRLSNKRQKKKREFREVSHLLPRNRLGVG